MIKHDRPVSPTVGKCGHSQMMSHEHVLKSTAGFGFKFGMG